MPQSKSRVPWVLALLIAASLWPYYGLLAQWPMTMDAVIWIERGWPGEPGWLEWVFQTRHFNVGYRPLTALTYSLGTAVGGANPFLHRAVDLAAHVSCALLVYALGRSLTPTRPRWTALIGVLFFVLHPALDQVVPYLARRSYSLSTACLLGALVIAVRSLREDPRHPPPLIASVPIAALLLIGMFLHEVAVVGVLLVPLLGFAVGHGRRDVRRAIAAYTVLPAVVLAVAWYSRSLVVEGMGGYQVDAEAGPRALTIFSEFSRALFALRAGSLVDSTGKLVELAVLILAVPYYSWAIYAAARAEEPRLVPLALLLWILGYGVVYASLGVWFPRQAYVAAVPLALLVSDVATTTLTSMSGSRRVLQLVPQVVLVVFIATHSPVVRGPDSARALKWSQWNTMFDAAERELETVREPATVRLVLPYRKPVAEPAATNLKRTGRRRLLPRGAAQPVRWLECLVRGREIEIEGFVYFESPPVTARWPSSEVHEGRRVIRIPDGLAFFVGERPHGAEGERVVRADEPPLPPERNAYLFMTSARGGEMLRLREEE